jgi:hypothetical protein
MQSTRWTSGCLEAIQRQLGPALRAKLHVVTTIIIEGEEAYATGCARVGELQRYALPEAAAGEPVLEAQGSKKSTSGESQGFKASRIHWALKARG